MNLEIVNHACKGTLEDPLSPHEEIYYPTVVGASLHCFEGDVLDAQIRFMKRATREHLCAIEVDTRNGPIACTGHGISRSAAFLKATEHLERRVFEVIHRASGLETPDQGPTSIAA